MKKIQTLKDERAAILSECRKLIDEAEAEGRSFDEVKTDVEAKMAEADKREGEIKTREELESRMVAERMREEVVENTPEGDGGFRSLGEFLHTVRFNPNDERLRAAPIGQTVGSDSGGGYLVPIKYSVEILTVTPQEAIVRPRATVIPADRAIPDQSIRFPALDYSENMYGGVQVEWLAEQDTKPETGFALNQIGLDPYEVAAHIPISDKLLRNSSSAEMLLTTLLRGAIVAAEDRAFLSGNGDGKPTGIIGHSGTLSVPRLHNAKISFADIAEMYGAWLGEGDGVFVASPTVLPVLMQMTTPLGQMIWQPNAAVSPQGVILGMPLITNQRSPVLGTTGDLLLADFDDYLIKDGYGIAIGMSEHVYFLKNTTVFKAFRLVDGCPWLETPFLLEDGVSRVSPFVTLGSTVSV